MSNKRPKRPINSPESDVSQVDKAIKMDLTQIESMLKSLESNLTTNLHANHATLEATLTRSMMEIKVSLKNFEENIATIFARIECIEKETESLRNDFMELEARVNETVQENMISKFRVTGLPPVKVSREGQLEFLLALMNFVGVTAVEDD